MAERLTSSLLLAAYTQGIFPMAGPLGRIEWYSPDPRAILPLDSFHASKTLMQTYRSGRFEIRVNSAFTDVIKLCAKREEGTWISASIMRAYSELHRIGFAHSVETWRGSALVGGLYGVAIGGAYFGESMFHIDRDASKVALVALVERMRERGFTLLDVQFSTPHLRQFGVTEIPRNEYLDLLVEAISLDRRFVERG